MGGDGKRGGYMQMWLVQVPCWQSAVLLHGSPIWLSAHEEPLHVPERIGRRHPLHGAIVGDPSEPCQAPMTARRSPHHGDHSPGTSCHAVGR